MHDAPIGARNTEQLRRTERRLHEIHQPGRPGREQVRRQGAESLSNPSPWWGRRFRLLWGRRFRLLWGRRFRLPTCLLGLCFRRCHIFLPNCVCDYISFQLRAKILVRQIANRCRDAHQSGHFRAVR